MTEVVDQPTGRTKWKRFGVVVAPSLAAATALGVMLANGLLAASFAVSGSIFKVSADRLDGGPFVQYGSTVQKKDGTPIPVVVSEIGSADLVNLCQSVSVGPLTVRITADPVEAENLVVDAQQIRGNAVFTNIDIGIDASEAKRGLPTGMFAQRANHVVINELEQVAYATTAGSFTLDGLSLGFGQECF